MQVNEIKEFFSGQFLGPCTVTNISYYCFTEACNEVIHMFYLYFSLMVEEKDKN